MKSVSSYYHQVCKQKYQPLGFLRSKSIYARIKGDVIQAFSLKRSQQVPTCTVEFGIFPLCLPQPFFLQAGGYELDQFVVEQYFRYGGWRFDPNSEESMKECVESMSGAMDLYLLPFFEKCSDCKSALSECIKLEELFEQNRLSVLQLRGTSDCAMPWEERSLFDGRKYYMALKSHNLSYAQRYLEHKVDYHDRSLKEFHAPNAPKQPESVIEKFAAARDSYAELLERLDSGDFAYFDDLLNSNEIQTREFLAVNYPKIQSNS